MPGITCFVSQTALIKSSFTPCSQSASLRSAKVPGLGGPVFYARMSTIPNFLVASSMRRSTSALMARSALTEYTSLFPVSFTIASRALEIESWFREEITTLQPSVARTLATPSPIPLLAAGTTATLLLSPRSKMSPTDLRRLKLILVKRSLMDDKDYLKRIGYRGPARPNVNVLRRLHRRHLLSIPFENLDIHLHRPIILKEAVLYDKIIKHRRGGFCYELNGSFARLLEKLGFKVSMLSARVARKGGGFSPDFDHMTLLVQLKEPWLADIGFGDSFTEPKRLNMSHPQADYGKDYRFTRKDEWIILSRRTKGHRISEPQYKFSLTPRKLEDFVPRCRWQQTSPRSHFRKGRLCTRLAPNGRLTLTDTKFIVTRGNKKVELPLKNPEEFGVLLRQRFGIDLS